MKITPKALLLILVFLAAVPVAQADWEGKMVSKVPEGNGVPSNLSGEIRMKKDHLRLDMKSPIDMSFLADMKNKKAWTLIHGPKLIMTTNIEKFQAQSPMCTTENIDECLLKKGFKKIGSEKIDGHPCTIYEVKNTKLWRPEDLKEVPSLKTLVVQAPGKVIETYITEVKMGKQDASLFEAPKDYSKMDGLQSLFK